MHECISMKVFLATVFLFSRVLCDDSGVSEQDDARRKMIERQVNTKTVLVDGYELVTRISATAVFRFRSYRNVAVMFYPIPVDVSEAMFMFRAENIHLNGIGSCDPVDVVIHLKRGSYPVVNPDGYPFPKTFIDADSRETVSLDLESDGRNRSYSVLNPKAGEWYGIAYLQWQDPRSQKVEQQGLFADCQTVLYTDLQVKRENINLIDCYSALHVNLSDTPESYKCLTSDNTSRMTLTLTVDAPDNVTIAMIKVQASSLPSSGESLVYCYFNVFKELEITFQPYPLSWHYITVAIRENVTNVAECESYSNVIDEPIESHSVVDLMRESKGMFFSYDYIIPSLDLSETISTLNVTSGEVTTLRFRVNPILDIGGTMSVAATLFMENFKYYAGFKRPFRSKNDTLLVFTESDPFYKVVLCLDIDHYSIPLEEGKCKFNDVTHEPLFILNTTHSSTIDDMLMIPFPEGGTWYLSMRLFCDNTVCPCRVSAENSTKYYVESSHKKIAEYKSSNEGGPTSRKGESNCNATVMVSVASMPCVNGRCGRHGSCIFTTSGGLIMSSCSCTSGYGGWDCSDGSRIDSYTQMMLSILLLTLSNLLFLFSVYTAVIRHYYAEAVMYTFTMIMSTFYHACDAPSAVSYCITSHSLLQFGDFYCGIMSFWVTLIAMSVVGHCLRNVLQLLGAIVVAFLTTWNMQSLVAFMAPVTFGIAIVFSSWSIAYRKEKVFIFPKTYYARYLPIGVALVSAGLVCFAFLQTEQNYMYVHSIWHMIIALSVACLLPDSKREGSEHGNPFLPTAKFWKIL